MLLHGIQHFIQGYEGFPNGTSRQQAYTNFLAAYERARAELDAAGLTRYSSDKRILGTERISKLSPGEQSILKKYLALKKIDDQQHAYTVTCLATARPPSLSRREGNRLPYYYKPCDVKVA